MCVFILYVLQQVEYIYIYIYMYTYKSKKDTEDMVEEAEKYKAKD